MSALNHGDMLYYYDNSDFQEAMILIGRFVRKDKKVAWVVLRVFLLHGVVDYHITQFPEHHIEQCVKHVASGKSFTHYLPKALEITGLESEAGNLMRAAGGTEWLSK